MKHFYFSYQKKAYVFLCFSFFLLNICAFAEGTKELQPDSTVPSAWIQIWDNNDPGRQTGTFNCDPLFRLNIRVCNVGEVINFGLNQTDGDVYFRLRAPNGTVLMGPTKVPASGAGYIKYWNQAAAGPLPAAGGYVPLSFTTTAATGTGDYYIEFNPDPATLKYLKRTFKYLDVTVKSAAGAVIKGRFWSRAWDLQCNSGSNKFLSKLYIFAKDSVVTAVSFNGMQPYGFTLAANSTGCTALPNDPQGNRKSRVGNITYPEYPIFLNEPDYVCFPTTTSFGALTKKTTISGCDPNHRCINVSVDKKGTVGITMDLNGVPGFQPGTKDLLIEYPVVVGNNCIPWNSLDGLGVMVPSGVSIPVEVNYYNGLTHLPLFDVENQTTGYSVQLVKPAGAPPLLFWDDSDITAGTAIDGKTNFNGCTPAPGCHRWSGRGNGVCTGPGCPETINTWWYANILKDTTSFVNAPILTDANFTNAVGAPNDTTVCINTVPIPLYGSVQGFSTSGTWVGGTGTFSAGRNSKTGTYDPSPSERVAGNTLKLILRSTNNGVCPAVEDTLRITFLPTPSANANTDQSICKNNPAVLLNGTKTNATGGTWSGGAGSFFPNSSTLVATYTPTAAELAAGTLTLTLSTTGNGKCAAASDQMIVSFTSSPASDAGTDKSSCKNNPAVPLSGSVTSATGGTWTGGGAGTFSPNANSLIVTFTPSAAQVSDGTPITLTLTTTGQNANCNSVSDQVVISFTASPTTNAGSDKSVCTNNADVALSGAVTVATGGTWSGGTGSFLPNANTLAATYRPSAAEIAASVPVTLTLTGTNNGGCSAVADQMVVSFTAKPTREAGSPKTVCSNNPDVILAGVVSTSGGTWSGGVGNFSPNANTLNATYTPSAGEIAVGIVNLFLTTNNNGTCLAEKDTLKITIIGAAIPNAGPDQSVCSNKPSIQLAGSATNASSKIWSGGTPGNFSDVNSFTSTYTPTAAEIAAGSLTLTLSVNRAVSAGCNPVADQMTISFTPSPTANAGSDQTVCANNADISLNGAVTVATAGTWTSLGTGNFANAGALSTTYTPSSADKMNGSVKLILTTANNGNCNAVTDTMLVTITPAPAANAGAAQSVCANNSTVVLNGSVTLASGGVWSGGTGTFAPNANALNATYTPSAGEIAAGGATLTLTTVGFGNCNAVNGTTVITITPPPAVNAGTDRNVCANNPALTMAGSVTVASGGIWSGGSGTFTPSPASLTASYTPSAAEVIGGTVTLTLTSTGNVNCNPVSDVMVIHVTPAPSVDAGSDQVICSSTASVALNGTVTVSAGGTWTSNGSGSFANANSLNTIYTPSAADKTTGFVTLTLTTSGNVNCTAISDQMNITFTTVPVINAGPDQKICTNDLPVNLSASGSPASWVGGAGTFSPDRNTLNAVYTPTPAEVASGSLSLSVTTIASGSCAPVTGNINLSFVNSPAASSGGNQTICGNTSTVVLNGTISNAASQTWTTAGSGSFTPDANTLTATYHPSAADKTAGAVILTLTSKGNGSCSADTSHAVITFQSAVAVNAGPDQTLCSAVSALPFNGTIANAPGGTWSSNGSGTIASPSGLSTSYTPSALDKTNGSVTLTLTSTSTGTCPALTDNIIFTFSAAPTANAGGNQTICGDIASVALNGSVTLPATGGTWTTIGSGTFSPNATSLTAAYFPTAAEKAGAAITFTLTTAGNGTCNAVQSQMVLTITSKPTINAGADQTVCADVAGVSLNGIATIASGGAWSSNGTGAFSPNANTLTTTYIPSPADINKGTVTLTLLSSGNGTCTAVSDQMLIAITPAPAVNAGADRTVCADVTGVNLQGAVTVATGGTWSSTGSGTFSPNTLSGNYNFSPADKTAGSVKLILTSSGNGTCIAKKDTVLVTITPKPTANAGNDQVVCSDTAGVILNGLVTVGTGGMWTSNGTGNFFPAPNALNATYVPSAADKTAGTVTLTLTTTGNGTCNAVTDAMIVAITPAPTVSAGSVQTVCGDVSGISLTGTSTVATGVLWSTSGTGTFSPNSNVVTLYVPSASDKAAGTVTLGIKTTGNGTCKSVNDHVIITITPAPTTNAGPDKTICADAANVSLNGQITIASGGTWTSGGTGNFLPDANSALATYQPSSADIAAGNVRLTLKGTGNGTCKAVSDTMTLFITPTPSSDAGADQTVCADAAGVSLSGTITGASGGTWSTGGTGTFTPNATVLTAAYHPSAADTAAHSVTLTLTTTGMGVCNAVSDQVVITINPKPIVNAGSDQSVCADFEGDVLAGGKVLNAAGGTWSSTGTGSFSPAPNDLTASYTPSLSDISSGNVTLTLTSAGMGTCNPVSDQMVLTVNPVPMADAGSNITACKDVSNIALHGIVSVATGATWTTTGDGTFANENNLITSYAPGSGDRSSGSVLLKLTTIGNGTCNPVTDSLRITLTNSPTVSAGPALTVCADTAGINLTGNVTIASGGLWTTGGSGTFSPNANTLNATYIPSAGDITAGSALLTLTTQGNGTCNPVNSQVLITITPAPVVNAGSDQTVCSDIAGVVLNGTVLNAAGGIWSTSSGTGTFNPGANSLNVTFVPSALQISNGKASLTLASAGNGSCKVVKDVMVINITPKPTVNAGSDVTVCAGIASVSLNGTITVATGASWTTNGGGTFLPNANTLNASYVPSAAENVNGQSVTLTLTTTTGNGSCIPQADQMVLSFNTIPVDAGAASMTVCSNALPAQLNGSGSGTWTGGLGTFSPDANTLNAKYNPHPTEIGGSVVLTLTSAVAGCTPGTDNITVNFIAGPTANAGANQKVCANNAAIALSGTKTNAGGLLWSADGSGTFSPDAITPNATYVPSAADKTNGSVTLTLSTTSNGTCPAASDTVSMIITPAPLVNAGGDKTVCADGSPVNINGSVTIAGGGDWTSTGTGSFAPSNNPVTVYTPSVADLASSGITLTLTSNTNGNCSAVSDVMLLKFSGGPTANAGPHQNICADTAGIVLNGSVTVASAGVWTTAGTGTFTPNAHTLNPTYIPSAADRALSSLTFTLTTTGNGTCTSATSQMTVSIGSAPIVNPIADQTICADVASISLNGSVLHAASGTWSTSGSGSFTPSAANPIASYIPSAADIAAGGANLTLTSTGNGTCKAVSNFMTVNITPKPTANAGFDQSFCKDVNTIVLDGSVTIATSGTWTTTGGGTFTPGANTLKTTYNAVAADKSGTLTFVLTSSNSGTCADVTDTMKVSFTAGPVVTAGANHAICADSSGVPLTGTKTVAAGVIWTSNGTGTFSPNATSLTPSYFPSAADTAAGNVKLTISSTGNGTCNAATAFTMLTIAPGPIVRAGLNQTICGNGANASLSGAVLHAAGGVWASTGTGTFTPSNSALTVTYRPSAADILAQAVNISLTSTGTGTCKPVSDFMTLTINPAPSAKVDAGFDQTLCADVTQTVLNGTVTNAGGGIWTTGGTGTFLPDATSLNATYALSATDKTLSSLTLTLTTTNTGICAPVSDQVVISMTSRPTASAGADQPVCGDVAGIALSGSVSLASGGIWTSGGTGTFVPNAATLTATYVPSLQDIAAGKVGLTLTTSGNGTCNPVSDFMIATIAPKPNVNAGADKTLCSDVSAIKITGTVTGATGTIWTSTGTGTFSPSATSLTASYNPSAADIASARVNLTLTTTVMGSCKAASDQMSVSFTPAPAVNAGPDKIVCADVSGVSLNGLLTVASGGVWTTSGSGIFSPSAAALNASYIPSAADKAAGPVTLTLTSTGNGTCNAVPDNLIITILPKPVVTAGLVSNCVFNSGAALSGSVINSQGGAGTGQWTSSGSGTFSPNAFTINATYFPSAADKVAGRATLSLNSTGNGSCNPAVATTTLIISPLPLANAGADQHICRGTGAIITAQAVPNVTYSWSTIAPPSVISSAQFTPVTAGKDTSFVLTVTDNKGCFSKDTVRILMVDPPSFNMPAHVCLNDTLKITAGISGASSLGVYQWFRNNVLIANQNDSTLRVTQAGAFKATYSLGSCSFSGSTNVTAPSVLVTSRKQVVCAGNQIILSTLAIPNTPGTVYNWDSAGVSIGVGNPLTRIASPGTNVYHVSVTDALGCSGYDSIKVIAIPKPQLSLKDSTTCSGGVITLSARPSNIINVDSLLPAYQWFKDGVLQPTSNDTLKVSASGVYVAVINLGGCSQSDTANIHMNPVPDRISPAVLRFCSETDSLKLNAGNPGSTYVWATTPPQTSQIISVKAPGVYHVTITNAANCSLNDSIIAQDICPPRVFVPSGFFPMENPGDADITSGRGKDAFFTVFGKFVTKYDLTIFNRWGEIIYHTTNFRDTWDGFYRGELMPVGVYAWTILYEGAEEFKGPYRLSGKLTLIR
jgi:gliding motility-associated-like protein